MKFLQVMLLMVVGAGVLFAQAAPEVKVNFIKTKAQNWQSVIVQGKVTQQIDDDEFILQDETGFIKVNLEDHVQHMAFGIVGATVRVFGMVDKEGPWDQAELDAQKIRVVSGGGGNPGAVPDNF